MRPGRRVFLYFIPYLSLAVLPIFFSNTIILWFAGTLLLFVGLALDFRFLINLDKIKVKRVVSPTLPVGVRSEVCITVTYSGRYKLFTSFFDLHPSSVTVEGLPVDIVLFANSQTEFRYKIKPETRGKIVFNRSQILVQGIHGLLCRSIVTGTIESAKVYPNFNTVSGYNLLATENRLDQLGIIKKRKRGEGFDFHQQRPYRQGDSLRQIDWKATSRFKKLISREYQEEKDQLVVFLLDCGRRMMAKDGELSHFDHTLNALLLLSYVALKQGDKVGLMTFSGENRYISPHKGGDCFNQLMNAIYDLKPRNVSSDYVGAAEKLMTILKKRSLVVILSNLRDDEGDDITSAINLLKRNHLVVFASLQEVEITQALQKEITTLNDALRVAAVHQYLNRRRKAHQKLKHKKVFMVDVEPRQLPIALVNKYLEIKSSQRL
jgi:uncharacterized protein (DUF58 family)